MTSTLAPHQTGKLLTFEEYRQLPEPPDNQRYELVRGRLQLMPTASGLHAAICTYLTYVLVCYLAERGSEGVARNGISVRTEEATSRITDVTVCSRSLWEQIVARPGAGILDFEEKPILVIEIVSTNRRDDYIRKRAEYNFCGIPEYWIVDPQRQVVLVFSNPERPEGYEVEEYGIGTQLRSPQFPELTLAIDTVLQPPLVETLVQEEQANTARLTQESERITQENEALRAKLQELGIDPNTL